jgi:hypothetical protein
VCKPYGRKMVYYKTQCSEKLGFLDEAIQYKNKVYEMDPNYEPGFIEVVATSLLIQAIVAPFQ